MGSFNAQILYDIEAIVSHVLVPVALGATCVLTRYAWKKGLMKFYARLILAMVIILLSYVMMLASQLRGQLKSSTLKLHDFNAQMVQNLMVFAFQLHGIPTMLYCWQYFDVVSAVIKIKST